jgi:hypothetical protein
MKRRFFLLFLASAVVAQACAAAAPSDRRPGVYQFTPISPSVCAGRQWERRLAPRPERLQKLGDLPPAYFIRLGDVRTAPIARPRPFAAPGYDPCATIERVK